jgi:putative FmdB family regulatory protein
MPTYEYACRTCEEHLEVVQSFKDDALTTCPGCGGELRKVFSAAGIIFKGSGWHIKDYASSGSSGGSGSADGSGSSSDDAKSSSESKSSSDSSDGSSSTETKKGSSDSSAGSTSSSSSSGSSSERKSA